MQNLQISEALHLILEHLRFDFTHLIILQQARDGKRLWDTLSAQQTLRRKGYLTDRGELTDAGRLLLIEMEAELHKEPEEERHQEIVQTVRKALTATRAEEEEALELFAKAYPSTTTWYDENGKKWEGGRSLKTPGKKQIANKLFAALQEVMHEGKTIGDIIAALEHDIANKKRKSQLSGRNEMDYMPAWGVFINQRRWEGIWEEMEFEKKQRPLSTGTRKPIDTTNLF